MSTQPQPKPAMGGLVQIGSSVDQSIEQIIQQRLAEERARLEREAGVIRKETAG